MSLDLEEARKDFYSKYHTCYESSNSSDYIEDCQFSIFTNLLEESEIIKSPPIVSRENGDYKRSKWSILGYSESNDIMIDGDNDDELESINNWHYVIFNGFFTNSDSLEVLNSRKDEIDKSLKECITFIDKTLNEDCINDITKASELQNSIIKAIEDDTLSKIDICIITDKIISQDNLQTSYQIGDFNININYWDLKRWSDLKRIKSRREPINIDFNSSTYNSYGIDFVKKKSDKFMTHYLAIFPANLIADLYERYDTRLLEKNVRVFLSAGRKANKAMRDTVKEDPSYFFSFNNGLSATVSKIHINDGRITMINDFQIVNGGQTTATIHYARKKDEGKDGARGVTLLSNVFVPVKITEITQSREINPSEIVSSISRAANTQSAIRNSDFYSNKQFLVDIERHSKRIPVSNDAGKNIYYFFERMTGQYNADMNSRGSNRNILIFKKEKPKAFKFGKIEIGRWYNCMNGFPHIAALSAEKQFGLFMEEKNFKIPSMLENQFKTMVGFGMVFNRIRKLIGKKNGREYPPLISDSSVAMATTIYSAAILHQISEGKLDYWKVFNHEYRLCESLLQTERVNTDLDEIIESVIKESWKQLKAFGQTSVQEQTKKIECWNFFQKNFSLSNEIEQKIENFMISDEEHKKRESTEVKDGFEEYFNSLDFIIVKNPNLLDLLIDITSRDSSYRDYKSILVNLKNRINDKSLILKINRVVDINNLYNKLVSKGNEIPIKLDNRSNYSLNFLEIYEIVIKNYSEFCNIIEDYIYNDDENFDINIEKYEKIKEIVEALDLGEGLSINEFIELQELTTFFKEIKIA